MLEFALAFIFNCAKLKFRTIKRDIKLHQFNDTSLRCFVDLVFNVIAKERSDCGNLRLICKIIMKKHWVCMMTNRNKAVIYTGLTNDLERRIQERKDNKGCSFAIKYSLTKLVYYESFSRINDAIAAEKRVKSGSRAKKIELIESINPYWKDLY